MKLLFIQTPSEQQFDDAVRKVLKSSDYAYLRNEFQDFIARIKESLAKWILDILKRAAPDMGSPSKISDNISTAFMIIGLLVILGIIIVVIINMSKTLDKKDKLEEILGEKIDDRTTPESLRNKASEFVGNGDVRMAVRFDFIALLLLMHEKNILYLDETRTNEEIYNYLKKNNFSNLSVFRYLITAFNHTWYGHKSFDKEGYDLWAQKMDGLWKEVSADEAKT